MLQDARKSQLHIIMLRAGKIIAYIAESLWFNILFCSNIQIVISSIEIFIFCFQYNIYVL